MTRAQTDMDQVDTDLAAHLKTLRAALAPVDGSSEDYAMCAVETFCCIAIRVMRKTNPSKVRSEARTVEIKARLDGVPVIREAA